MVVKGKQEGPTKLRPLLATSMLVLIPIVPGPRTSQAACLCSLWAVSDGERQLLNSVSDLHVPAVSGLGVLPLPVAQQKSEERCTASADLKRHSQGSLVPYLPSISKLSSMPWTGGHVVSP